MEVTESDFPILMSILNESLELDKQTNGQPTQPSPPPQPMEVQNNLYPTLPAKVQPPKRPPQPEPHKIKHIVEERRKCSEELRIKLLQQNQAVIIEELKKTRKVLKSMYSILQNLQRPTPSAPPEIRHEDHCCLCTK